GGRARGRRGPLGALARASAVGGVRADLGARRGGACGDAAHPGRPRAPRERQRAPRHHDRGDRPPRAPDPAGPQPDRRAARPAGLPRAPPGRGRSWRRPAPQPRRRPCPGTPMWPRCPGTPRPTRPARRCRTAGRRAAPAAAGTGTVAATRVGPRFCVQATVKRPAATQQDQTL
ncbi:MAG: Similarities with tr/Q12218 Saccharomyces cerevisiae YOR009w, partial [uncultured Phycisphaerae bacterium]